MGLTYYLYFLFSGEQGEQSHLSAAQRHPQPVSGEEWHLCLQGLQSKVLHNTKGKKDFRQHFIWRGGGWNIKNHNIEGWEHQKIF